MTSTAKNGHPTKHENEIRKYSLILFYKHEHEHNKCTLKFLQRLPILGKEN